MKITVKSTEIKETWSDVEAFKLRVGAQLLSTDFQRASLPEGGRKLIPIQDHYVGGVVSPKHFGKFWREVRGGVLFKLQILTREEVDKEIHVRKLDPTEVVKAGDYFRHREGGDCGRWDTVGGSTMGVVPSGGSWEYLEFVRPIVTRTVKVNVPTDVTIRVLEAGEILKGEDFVLPAPKGVDPMLWEIRPFKYVIGQPLAACDVGFIGRRVED